MPTENWTQSIGGKAYRVNSNGVLFTTNKEDRYISQSRTSVRTVGFHKGSQSSRHGLQMNNFDFSRSVITRPIAVGSIVAKYWSSPRYYSDTYSGSVYGIIGPQNNGYDEYGIYISLSQAESDAQDAKAITKLLNKVKDQKVNLAQAYAERAQTADLIAVTAKRLAEAVTHLKKGSYRKAASALGVSAPRRKVSAYTRSYKRDQSAAVSRGWLELQYGWKPLLSDVYGSAEFLAQKASRELVSRASVSVNYKLQRTISYPSLPGYSNWKRVAYGEIDRTVKYVVYFSSSSAVHTLAQTGLSNPLLLAWELLPWSFVVDWFIPIGNYLGSLDAVLGVTFEKGCRTVFTRRYSHATDSVNDPPTTSQTFMVGKYFKKQEQVTCSRSPMGSFPLPQTPAFKNPLSFEHAANALALLRQAFKR